MELVNIDLPGNLENMQLPDPSLLNYWRLAENRCFYIDYEIDESVLEIQKAIININKEDYGVPVENRVPIKIFIDSPGGLLAETMSLATTMIMSTTPVITINIATAYSGGALLLLAGHKKYALPYSKAMIHTGSGCTSGTYEQTVEQQKIYKIQVDEMGKYILERSGMDEKVYKKNRNKEWYLTSDDQIKYGIVDEVLNSIDDII